MKLTKKALGRLGAILLALVMCLSMLPTMAFAADDELTNEDYLWENLTNPDEDETGDVTLTVVTTENETETYQYANIMDAVKKLFSYMNHGENYQTNSSYSASTTWYNPNGRGYFWSGVDYTWDYSSAVISFTEAHCEHITTSVQFKSKTSGWQYASLDNVTFDGNGTGSIVGDPAESYDGDVIVSGDYQEDYAYMSSDLKGTLTISGNNCTVQNISFVGNHTWVFTYYTYDNAIGVGSGVTDLTIQNNSFTGYTLVTAFGQSGGTVTNEVFDSNTVDGCLFLFHTADGGATNLTVTNNTLIGSEQYTLASCMAYTTVADFSGNTLTYASFGLQNCDGTDMSTFLDKNTYDHGYIYQETVDYNSGLGYYYHPTSTTVMTILPAGVYSAVWTSDYNTAGQMDEALTYTQQDAINDAVANSTDPTYATLTWTGGGTDEDGNLLDGGLAIGYNYNALHLGYGKVTEPGLDKTIVLADGTEVDQDDVAAGETVEFQLASTVPDALSDYIEYTYDADEGAVGAVKEDATYTLTFHDVMDEALTLDTTSFEVKVGDKLLVNTDEVTYYTVTTSNTDGCTFEITMDLLALYSAGIITEDDFGKTAITVTYSAKLSEKASAGAYYNTAWVAYPNGESKEDKVEVDTYKLSVFKYDQDTAEYDEDGNLTSATGLAGATFTVYSDEECTKIITTIESGSDGYATLDGLDAGTYYLKETEAPDGYVKADTILTVVIPAEVTDNVASVSFANAPIPSTGGAGTTMYTIAGICILLAAGAIFMITRRKRNAE